MSDDPTVELNTSLSTVTSELDRSEVREGQHRMARLVEDAIAGKRHLVVQAGTGTGKTLAYLVPAITTGSSVVVATATKALQDQLATKDLPFLAEHLGIDFDWAVLKGRSNYVCLQRLREVENPAQGELDLGDMAVVTKAEIKKIAAWAADSDTGDQAELDWTPSDNAWRAVSVGSDECPGAERCPLGDPCFAEQARRRAQAADVTVVNTHLYGLNVAAEGAVLPDHDVVIFDEAHVLEDVMSDTVGVEISPGRFIALAATIRRIIDDPQLIASVAELGEGLRDALSGHIGERLPNPLPDSIQEPLNDARLKLGAANDVIVSLTTKSEDAKQRQLRAQTMTGRSIQQLDIAIEGREGYVAFVSGSRDSPRLEVAPLDVGPTMDEGVWKRRTAILTSATIPSSLATRVGMPASDVDVVDVGSPFDYESNSMLYCAIHLPNPNSPDFRAKANDELEALIRAAGGRTLALFTSYKAMDEAAEAMRSRLDNEILTQRDMPKTALVKAFADDESTCLFATAGLFQGVDVPGKTLSLVVIDRIPFPRPDDPLLSARRDLLGRSAFSEIDIPRASMMLAQAAGRLIRSATDTGVVAVMDPRLGKANYRWDIVKALPPMKRTRHRSEVEAFLRTISGSPDE
ncbi:ATP-dependent DNA helicase [Ilumatobacter coccineus]|uniref:DNA 5'-3' helicase n=1 Tax=Ilumatobacter coccineus (strain NBRC 103263 / KCTC 29153 / YM16-304) TaxID=1313172 RepID=A0A6C7E8P7_ILUCY|nr:ATP-dependent DNA helicase [Ilumatobacter coccineus]BAN02733.1 putative ATP-dependent helicase [Ilumatobacter coccineus YM16-304]